MRPITATPPTTPPTIGPTGVDDPPVLPVLGVELGTEEVDEEEELVVLESPVEVDCLFLEDVVGRSVGVSLNTVVVKDLPSVSPS
jgi:hypothetical protein